MPGHRQSSVDTSTLFFAFTVFWSKIELLQYYRPGYLSTICDLRCDLICSFAAIPKSKGLTLHTLLHAFMAVSNRRAAPTSLRAAFVASAVIAVAPPCLCFIRFIPSHYQLPMMANKHSSRVSLGVLEPRFFAGQTNTGSHHAAAFVPPGGRWSGRSTGL